MTSRDFCYWLQGVLEVANPQELNAQQLAIVKAHLALVLVHEIDPSFGPAKAQEALNKIHGGGGMTGGPLMRC